jgi:hypothetical protein
MAARIGFEAPDSVRELVDLLNRGGKWELTLVTSAGKVYGRYQTDHFQSQVAAAPTQVLVYNGDVDDPDAHPVFAADSDEDALCFLSGLFLGVFGGKSLEAIQDELDRHRNERLY